jgi:hypothetical protein
MEQTVDFRSPERLSDSRAISYGSVTYRKRVTGNQGEWMKYICLGYLEPGKFENMSESERNTVLDECFSYNDELRENGHLVAEEPLQPANTAVTVGWKNGKVVVTAVHTRKRRSNWVEFRCWKHEI